MASIWIVDKKLCCSDPACICFDDIFIGLFLLFQRLRDSNPPSLAESKTQISRNLASSSWSVCCNSTPWLIQFGASRSGDWISHFRLSAVVKLLLYKPFLYFWSYRVSWTCCTNLFWSKFGSLARTKLEELMNRLLSTRPKANKCTTKKTRSAWSLNVYL